jgi:orotidine-5'-phosphate decarboxylase
MDPRDRLIVALDTASLARAEAIADDLSGIVRWYKIGPHLFTAAGPAAVTALLRRGRIFLDLKFHDIPSVVSSGVEAAADMGASLCTVHTLGGTAMMRAAREGAAAGSPPERPPMRVIGVTVLTSTSSAVLEEMGLSGAPQALAVRLARLAKDAGLAGVVTSPLEAEAIRRACGRGFLLVCPGIRPEGAERRDQHRVDTPRAAIRAGADVLVVGRPITLANDPRAAADEILEQIAGA